MSILFDYTTGDFIFGNSSGRYFYDSDGNALWRTSDNWAVDEDGEYHYIRFDDEDDDFSSGCFGRDDEDE